MNMNKKAALHNLGCKVNAYELNAVAELLKDAGYEIVPFGESADVYVINTCTVTNVADRKSRQMLNKAKKMNPDAVVVALGCYVQSRIEMYKSDGIKEEESTKSKILEDVPADIILGNNHKKDIVQILEQYYDLKDNIVLVDDLSKPCEYENSFASSTYDEHLRASVKIQDGCNQFCSYCIIPFARGRIRSRGLDSIKVEVNAIAKNGIKEIVYTGIHLSSYGLDFAGMQYNEERSVDVSSKALYDVIFMTSQVKGIERIRLGSLEPRIITEEFMEKLSKIGEFCPQFHLSLQSGSDAVLKLMNRKYTTTEYLEKCDLIRKYFKDAAITTDIIVGFPGEGEKEFEETNEFVKAINFSKIHVFKYSKRKGTVAAKMKDQVDERVKARRSECLILSGNLLQGRFTKGFVGQKKDVYVESLEEFEGKKYLCGFTKEYVRTFIEIDESCDTKKVNEKIRISESAQYIGKIVSVLGVRALNDEILLAQIDKIY